jgi:hypothetical protein
VCDVVVRKVPEKKKVGEIFDNEKKKETTYNLED